MKVRQIIKRLKQDGWFHVRTKGDHRQFHHPLKPGTVTVAGKLSEDIPPRVKRLIREAMALHIQDLRRRGLRIPRPTAASEFIELEQIPV